MKANLQRLIEHLRGQIARTGHLKYRAETKRLLIAAESILSKLEGGRP